jgi:hypothetical protein
MAERTQAPDSSDPSTPTRDPAEGARENVNIEEGASGISTRPIEQEQREQQNLPPRGRSRGEHDA